MKDEFLGAFRRTVRADQSLTDEDRDALLRGVQTAIEDEPPPTIAIIGVTGVGKSSTINSLFNAGREVGHSTPTTSRPDSIDVDLQDFIGEKGTLRIIDMPGLGDVEATYGDYLVMYEEFLPKADVILWTHEAGNRGLQFVQSCIRDLFQQRIPHCADRVVFGLNKADAIGPTDWNQFANIPSRAQEVSIADFERHFAGAVGPFFGAQPRVVSYSALRRYQLAALVRALVEHMPEERKWVLSERIALADFLDLVDRTLLEGLGKLTPTEVAPEPMTIDQALGQMSDDQYKELTQDRSRLAEFLRRFNGRG